eukprot:80636-Amphidinium_carterae.1
METHRDAHSATAVLYLTMCYLHHVCMPLRKYAKLFELMMGRSWNGSPGIIYLHQRTNPAKGWCFTNIMNIMG